MFRERPIGFEEFDHLAPENFKVNIPNIEVIGALSFKTPDIKRLFAGGVLIASITLSGCTNTTELPEPVLKTATTENTERFNLGKDMYSNIPSGELKAGEMFVFYPNAVAIPPDLVNSTFKQFDLLKNIAGEVAVFGKGFILPGSVAANQISGGMKEQFEGPPVIYQNGAFYTYHSNGVIDVQIVEPDVFQ